MRYHLQRVRTGEWLTRDLPVRGGGQVAALSGPGQISGTVEGTVAGQLVRDGLPLLDEWSTAIYADDGSTLRGGIVQNTSYLADGTVSFTAPGFCSYATGIPWTSHPLPSGSGSLDPTIPLETIYAVLDGQYRNPIRIFRAIWLYIQAQPRSNIGLEVDDVGGWHGQLSVRQGDLTIGTAQEPYGISWWANLDLGADLNALAANTPFDYYEMHTWNADKTAVNHRLKIGTYRLGTARSDLRFVLGENLAAPVEFESGDYANELHGIGKGNGAASVRVVTSTDDGKLRRPRTFTDKTSTRERIQSQINAQLVKMLDPVEVSQVIVREHPNAPIAVLTPGDDILVQARHRGRPKGNEWVRILSIERTDGSDVAALTVQRSSAFNYSTTFAEGANFDAE